ncbi:DUF4382 domain-containing protein [Anaerophaga thermohalophila]|jgi:hypothetical protein|uniref:DUF4382 domain-containing protein n=1 Tax=Anaerophaga thermohalophila TaxID=177400 RepID=UPI0002EE6AEB|nr:DUF4382 domain-containing protein [Anaerophaga thermohalophila]
MKKLIFLTAVLAMPFLIASCSDDETSDKGTLKLSITDAPLDTDGITAVNITVNEVQYHIKDNEWRTFEEFEADTFNLLELTNGNSELLGRFELGAGTYTQLRFILDAPEKGQSTPSNPGCYLEFEDGSTQALFVPSGSESGFKGTGAFTVPLNGEVAITADFDARKSVVKAGTSGMYILKPTIRLVVDNQAGSIKGQVSNIPEGSNAVVYAYESDTYTEEEAAEPEEEAVRFPNAVTSSMAGETGEYTLSYLAPGAYDLVVVETIEGAFNQVLGTVEDVEVESLKESISDINIDEL